MLSNAEEPPFRYDERDRACPFTECFHHSLVAAHSVLLQPKRTRERIRVLLISMHD